ncbi:MAG TPA: zf-HC2 domain-containing protein [Phycisphaerae bacterium]|nr:zf-HC2 domain-containing protein [Phycisphaerae bacterium]
MLTCRHVQHLHDRFLDGDLTPSMTAEIHAHLLQCPACQHQMEISRASADVIARDDSHYELDSGFAMRVVAALPKPSPSAALGSAQRSRRRRVWRIVGMAALPAAAAALFIAVVILPTAPTTPRPTFVAGKAVEAAGVQDLMNPTLDAVDGTRRAAKDLNQLLQISVQGVGEGVRKGIENAKPPRADLTPMDVLLLPFNDALVPEQPKSDDPAVVRF